MKIVDRQSYFNTLNINIYSVLPGRLIERPLRSADWSGHEQGNGSWQSIPGDCLSTIPAQPVVATQLSSSFGTSGRAVL
jgi:hypothetical protein